MSVMLPNIHGVKKTVQLPTVQMFHQQITTLIVLLPNVQDNDWLSELRSSVPPEDGEFFWAHFQLRIFSSINLFFWIIENNRSPWNFRLLHVASLLVDASNAFNS